ncbi:MULTISPECIES: class I SAM-dependent methyltransferase [unclassified Fictibacillus]|uniref:class I SAM-dependent methyltransferase n=1 Tax=unclassified Fictibacillus TaxID=2644029 RepID=UPI0008EB33BF|nr:MULTISPECIES: class I SAM-dependent methyltransferase [unclassified Fictibacillus]MED2974338.1 class I SAM-dependent methyltransferase [Fictibacillus sp. B-59209]UZJ78898.1 class I SAM-dependent methyltransferase [Fictibacillus sp. KU28468]SFF11586.1 16S rRNA (guanine1207-N2)-methyltransferase [Bacillus sp. OV194]
MGGHYYSERPDVKSDPKNWTFTLRNHEFKFTSDSGVFSKKEVDFGSRLLIEEFVSPGIEGDYLDVGCGYGPIGLAIAKENPGRRVLMVDINERALELSAENAKKNGISNIEVRKSSLFENVAEMGFAAILTNPPIRAGKKVVHQLFEDSYDKLQTDGELWIVIQKKQGAPSAIEKLQSVFAEVETVSKSKGYYIIRAIKR